MNTIYQWHKVYAINQCGYLRIIHGPQSRYSSHFTHSPVLSSEMSTIIVFIIMIIISDSVKFRRIRDLEDFIMAQNDRLQKLDEKKRARMC